MIKIKVFIYDLHIVNIIPSIDEEENKQKNNDINEIKEKPDNNIIQSVTINNYVNKINEEKNINEEIKTNEKADTEISITINEETNINTNKGHKKNFSSISPRFNQELIERNIIENKANENGGNLEGIKDKVSNSSKVTEEGGIETNNNRRQSGRISDTSEKLNNIFLERKIPSFKTNFEEEGDNNEIKKIKNQDNNI